MKIENLIQGSPEWLAYRAEHFNASDAAAMLGESPNETRAHLLRRIYTGLQRDFSSFVQERVIASGHESEGHARPLAERIVGEELYPVVGSLGRLSASFDGLTLMGDVAFEHKQLNAALRAAIRQQGGNANEFLPALYRIQMEQQLLVAGAERVLFMASDWDDANELLEERHCWYTSDAALRQRIVDGWTQFERDLAAFEMPAGEAGAPTGKAPETLPALRIEVSGQVTASNLAEFKATALEAIRSVNRTLTTDQDFADAAKAVKWCEDVEARLVAAKQHALSQTASIDELFRTMDDIGAEARAVRLDLDKLVTRRKTEVKEEAVARARKDLDQHIATLNAEIAPMRLQPVVVDFAGAIKSLKSVASMQDKLDGALLAGKSAADTAARGIRANLATFKTAAEGFEFLFADLVTFVHKTAEDFGALVTSRIATHKANEERKRAEAERQRVAAEAASQQRREQEAAQQAAQAQATPAPQPLQRQETAAPAVVSASQARHESPPKRHDEPATLLLGAICARLGFTITAQFLADTLHITPAKVDRSAKLYTESQFRLICRQLMVHIGAMEELHAGEPA